MILVACPTYAGKDYALARWVQCWQDFDYGDRAMFMVDNTLGTLDYLHRVRSLGVPAVHVEPMPDFWDTMEASWRLIVDRAHEMRCEWIASIEADMVCPPETLSVLLQHSGGRGAVFHGYPARDATGGLTMSLGCALLSTARLYATRDSWRESMEHVAVSLGPLKELTGILDIGHLDG